MHLLNQQMFIFSVNTKYLFKDYQNSLMIVFLWYFFFLKRCFHLLSLFCCCFIKTQSHSHRSSNAVCCHTPKSIRFSSLLVGANKAKYSRLLGKFPYSPLCHLPIYRIHNTGAHTRKSVSRSHQRMTYLIDSEHISDWICEKCRREKK
jgi:hypothetical protein